VRLVIDLAEAEGLQEAIAELVAWYEDPALHIRSDGQWVKIGRGNQHREGQHQFAWRITGVEVEGRREAS
jgi:hypothetical protein